MKVCEDHKLKFRTRKTAWKTAMQMGSNFKPFRCPNGKTIRHWHLTSKGVNVVPPKSLTNQTPLSHQRRI